MLLLLGPLLFAAHRMHMRDLASHGPLSFALLQAVSEHTPFWWYHHHCSSRTSMWTWVLNLDLHSCGSHSLTHLQSLCKLVCSFRPLFSWLSPLPDPSQYVTHYETLSLVHVEWHFHIYWCRLPFLRSCLPSAYAQKYCNLSIECRVPLPFSHLQNVCALRYSETFFVHLILSLFSPQGSQGTGVLSAELPSSRDPLFFMSRWYVNSSVGRRPPFSQFSPLYHFPVLAWTGYWVLTSLLKTPSPMPILSLYINYRSPSLKIPPSASKLTCLLRVDPILLPISREYVTRLLSAGIPTHISLPFPGSTWIHLVEEQLFFCMKKTLGREESGCSQGQVNISPTFKVLVIILKELEDKTPEQHTPIEHIIPVFF